MKPKHAKPPPLAPKTRDQTKLHRPAGKFFLRLFVAGATARSREALRRVCQLCEAELKDNYELEVIDVYQQPELARENQIVATPTLIKEAPRPVRRFIGNLVNLTALFDDSSAIVSGSPAL